jgi:hypothetical protein
MSGENRRRLIIYKQRVALLQGRKKNDLVSQMDPWRIRRPYAVVTVKVALVTFFFLLIYLLAIICMHLAIS